MCRADVSLNLSWIRNDYHNICPSPFIYIGASEQVIRSSTTCTRAIRWSFQARQCVYLHTILIYCYSPLICDPIWQNESEVAYWNFGDIIRSWIYTPLKWYSTQLSSMVSSENMPPPTHRNVKCEILSFWENGLWSSKRQFVNFLKRTHNLIKMK